MGKFDNATDETLRKVKAKLGFLADSFAIPDEYGTMGMPEVPRDGLHFILKEMEEQLDEALADEEPGE